ncbi:MAG: Lrp/AsnC family transcriptional regulator [Ignavibacteriae bacterium]|nr:Lrp/AsnC family transcriptional regulator [Ignavibacteriota bacterium]
MIDDIDRKILNILQENAKTPNVTIARKVGMAPSAILERIRKLEERGVISAYEAKLDPEALRLGLAAFVFVRADEKVGGIDTAKQLAKIPHVQEVHHIAGEDCYLVKLRAQDTQELARLMREQFGKINTIKSTRTTIVFETIKETGKLPLSESVAKTTDV